VNSTAFEQGKASYRAGDYAAAVSALTMAKQPGELSGSLDHMRGNAYMKLGMFQEAAAAYGEALLDTSYAKQGALHANRGRALMATGAYDEAIDELALAANDPGYPTPYKAYLALGNIYEAKKMPREAGAAFRNAAIDQNNPDPASALAQLGTCFMELGRPVDAVEALRTALDFSTTEPTQSAIYAQLGCAFVATNRMSEALEAFQHALASGAYTLQPNEQASMVAAQNAVAALTGLRKSDTDALLAATGYGTGSHDPLDPLGKSGEFMPSPEDTGFFSVTESDLMAQDSEKKRKKHHPVRNALIVFFILVAIFGGAGYAYYAGYGWPTQGAVVENLFDSKATGTMSDVVASSVSKDALEQIESIIPTGATLTFTGIERSMNSSTVDVTAKLISGGTQDYVVTLVRDGISWKVSGVELSFASTGGTASTGVSTTTTTTGSTTTGSSASTDATAATTSSDAATSDAATSSSSNAASSTTTSTSN
jgi:tetratricopeptide (TPR) repeat protein